MVIEFRFYVWCVFLFSLLSYYLLPLFSSPSFILFSLLIGLYGQRKPRLGSGSGTTDGVRGLFSMSSRIHIHPNTGISHCRRRYVKARVRVRNCEWGLLSVFSYYSLYPLPLSSSTCIHTHRTAQVRIRVRDSVSVPYISPYAFWYARVSIMSCIFFHRVRALLSFAWESPFVPPTLKIRVRVCDPVWVSSFGYYYITILSFHILSLFSLSIARLMSCARSFIFKTRVRAHAYVWVLGLNSAVIFLPDGNWYSSCAGSFLFYHLLPLLPLPFAVPRISLPSHSIVLLSHSISLLSHWHIPAIPPTPKIRVRVRDSVRILCSQCRYSTSIVSFFLHFIIHLSGETRCPITLPWD